MVWPIIDVTNACYKTKYCWSWWRHQIETFSALQAICVGNSLVSGEFPAQRPVTWSFDVFFDLYLNKRLSKQSWVWWFEALSLPLWRHRNVLTRSHYALFHTITSILPKLFLLYITAMQGYKLWQNIQNGCEWLRYDLNISHINGLAQGCNNSSASVYLKNFHDSSDICPMGFIYSIQICEISHQTFGPSHRKCPTCPMIFMNTGALAMELLQSCTKPSIC